MPETANDTDSFTVGVSVPVPETDFSIVVRLACTVRVVASSASAGPVSRHQTHHAPPASSATAATAAIGLPTHRRLTRAVLRTVPPDVLART